MKPDDAHSARRGGRFDRRTDPVAQIQLVERYLAQLRQDAGWRSPLPPTVTGVDERQDPSGSGSAAASP